MPKTGKVWSGTTDEAAVRVTPNFSNDLPMGRQTNSGWFALLPHLMCHRTRDANPVHEH